MEQQDTIIIRTATKEDAAELLRVYAPYVEKTAISFEYEVPSVEEFAGRVERTLQKFPYLVAEQNGKIGGYCYASPFINRPAYDYGAEMSIYIAEDMRGLGLGKKLYDKMEQILSAQGILNVNACIGYTRVDDDPHLNNNSQHFHEHMGYRLVGRFSECGYKFDTWYDMIWMEKMIGEHGSVAPKRKDFPEVAGQFNL